MSMNQNPVGKLRSINAFPTDCKEGTDAESYSTAAAQCDGQR